MSVGEGIFWAAVVLVGGLLLCYLMTFAMIALMRWWDQ